MTTQVSSLEEEILELLLDGDVESQKTIINNTGYSQGHISKTLGEMEERGLVNRVNDGRRKEVQLAKDQSQIDVSLSHNGESKQKLDEIRELREPQADGGSAEIEFDEDLLEQPDQEEEVEGISRDQAYHLLSTSRRRDVIKYLDEIDSQSTTSGELAEEIAALENDKDVEEINSQERKRVYVSLIQVHMEKLYESAVVETSRNHVEPGENFDIMKELVREDFDQSNSDTAHIGGGISIDDAFGILGNSRRRDMIRYFLHNSNSNNIYSEDSMTQISLGDMAEEVAAVEYGKDIEDVTGREKQRLYVGLMSSHVGILDEQDIIDYDEESKMIEPGKNIDVLSNFVADSFEDPDEYLTIEDVNAYRSITDSYSFRDQ